MKLRKWGAGIVLAGTLGTGGVYGADRAIDPYDDKGTHYELPIKADIQQGERVEIAKDRAAMTLKGWNDEYAITITPQIPTALLGAEKRDFDVPADRPLLSKKMEFKSGDVTAFIEPKEGTENEFDIDFTLDAKPDTNLFTYEIEGAEQFEFFYQPELNAEEIAQGVVRPENVVGSYAVYHKTKANHRVGSTNYATGKAFHIYRPKAIDANGAEVWAELSYADGVLAVTVPEKWLETATYPVVVDPTFGYSTVGATTVNHEDDLLALQATLPTAGNVTRISAFIEMTGTSPNYDFYGAVYDTSRNLIAASPLVISASASPQWRDTYVSTSLSADDYMIASTNDYNSGSGVGIFYFRDTVASTMHQHTNPSGVPNPYTLSTDLSGTKYSIYASYTTTDAGTYTDLFQSAGYASWTAPTGVTSADVACWGSGGGGGDGTNDGGPGAGAGAFASSTVTVTPGTQYTIFIATGGVGRAAGSPGAAVAGANSTFATTTVVAAGATAFGGGGTAAASTGTTKRDGGSGNSSNTTSDGGGGGGGAGGPHGAGANGSSANTTVGGGGGGANGGSAGGQPTGGTSTNGGAGGNGGNGSVGSTGVSNVNGGGGGGGGDDGTRGGDGGTPGGGGGGGENGGGNGGHGQCTVTYTISGGGGGGDATGGTPTIYIRGRGYQQGDVYFR